MINIKEIELIQTCYACPEQYDAFIGNEKVGYLRLRHGYFSIHYPDSGGELIYEAYPKGDGLFEYEERKYYLEAAKAAILKRHYQDVIDLGEMQTRRIRFSIFKEIGRDY